MRKRLALLLISIFLLQNIVIAEGDVFSGHAEYTDEMPSFDKELFTGTKEVLEKRDTIEMTVSQVIDGSFSFEGDEFFAQVTSDVYGNKGVIIPKGTVAHGSIMQTREAKRGGRDGYINLSFDYLVTPDGRQIPIEGKMSTKLHPVTAAAKIVATDVGYTVAGGAIGGFMAVQALGIEAAIASQGYTIAGGAAIGGAVGLGMSLYRKGKDVLIAPGDEIKVKILSNVELPVYKQEALIKKEMKYPGLDVNLANILYEKDPFGEANTLTLSLAVSNMSDKSFSGMDIYLINDYDSIFNPSIFGDTKLLFSQFKPGDRRAGKMSFAVDNLRHSYWLVVNDRATNKPIMKISLDNAYNKVSDNVKKHNSKVKQSKKNYYKEDPFDI